MISPTDTECTRTQSCCEKSEGVNLDIVCTIKCPDPFHCKDVL